MIRLLSRVYNLAKRNRSYSAIAGIILAASLFSATRVVSCETGDNCGVEDGPAGFSISVDGEHVAGDRPTSAGIPKSDRQRTLEERLRPAPIVNADVQIKYDGLELKPILNISTEDLRMAYREGETVRFLATSNYTDWIDRAEIRIYPKGKILSWWSPKTKAVIPINMGETAEWIMPSDEIDQDGYTYILRVYDSNGRYDETEPLSLIRSATEFSPHEKTGEVVSAGRAEDRTAFRNIPVHGGTITVYGRDIPSGYKVVAFGEEIPVDQDGGFVVQRLMPAGNHIVDVEVSDGYDSGLTFAREVHIPDNEWFYVGLADITVGKRFASDAIEAADPGRYKDIYSKGRFAFYLKGKIKGRYILTAAADTGEEELDNILRGLDEKDPRQLLRRIDPDDYYPVYGDDSTAVEDAPTTGKFYVRLERGDSHVLWGNYKNRIEGNGLLRNERGLYGAQAIHRSPATTSFGERRFEATAYAAQPDTLPQRDIFRGTGGSAYFLKRQDITRGSETVTVFISDPVSGRITERILLTAGKDYEIDYIQGVMILRRPLSSHAYSDGVVRDRVLGENDVSLAVSYEYTPTTGDVDGYSYGGRVQAWFDDHLRVGATGMSEETGAANQEMIGADVQLRYSENTFVEAEYAETKGPGFGRSNSTDGGLTFIDEVTAGQPNRTGRAVAVRGQLDLSDINPQLKGRLGGYYEKKTAGFSSLDHNITVNQLIWGAFAHLDFTEKTSLKAEHEDYSEASGKKRRDSTIEVEHALNEYWKIAFGVTYTDQAVPAGMPYETGSRLDAGARLEWRPDEDHRIYVFGQATVDRSGGLQRNDRLGIGGEVQLTEKLGLTAEVSDGTRGVGAFAALTYYPTADDHYYLGYRLDPDRSWNKAGFSGRDLGGIVVGAKRRINDALNVFAENNYDMFGQKKSLASTYGVSYTPDAAWTLTGGLEFADIVDPNASDFTRHGVSLSINYKDGDNLSARMRGEVRLENSSDNTRDRQTYLLSGGILVKVSDDWRLVANANAVISNSDQSSFLDGDYIEASLGFAYRPAGNDRLNALFKYTFLYDLPGPGQVTINGTPLGPAQRSHVLSADISYELNRYLTIGGKYGFRLGEVSTSRLAQDFMKSTAHLGVIRADIHVIHNWDILFEGRVLHVVEAGSTRFGALAAIYRHLGNNWKLGVGYNFGHFSDELTDLTYDGEGVFLNIVGKY